MKYLRKFNTEADVMMTVQPNVVLVADTESVMFNVPMPNGAYIQHIDGKLYTTDQWTTMGFANDQANGVAVIDSAAKFVIAKTQNSYAIPWSSDSSTLVDGVVTASNSTTAKTDYAGESSTALIAAIDTSGAAYSCANYEFPNGQKGYLPALGEWAVAYNYKADIVSAMSLIGGTAITNTGYWSSTQKSATSAWLFNWSTGAVTSTGKSDIKYGNNYARAFTALNI